MARVVLVRHGHPCIEGDTPSRWTLSHAGRQAVRALGRSAVWETVRRIYTSPEPKARETAQILGDEQGLPVEITPDLGEVRRPFEARGFEDKMRAFLKGKAPSGWEARKAAQARVRRAVRAIGRGGVDAGAVSHATLLTLFLAEITGTEPTYWLHHSIGFAEYAIYDADARSFVRGFRGSETDPRP
ncbi:MAG: histidine phosphatase family protein [Thermoplasmata archaeon]